MPYTLHLPKVQSGKGGLCGMQRWPPGWLLLCSLQTPMTTWSGIWSHVWSHLRTEKVLRPFKHFFHTYAAQPSDSTYKMDGYKTTLQDSGNSHTLHLPRMLTSMVCSTGLPWRQIDGCYCVAAWPHAVWEAIKEQGWTSTFQGSLLMLYDLCTVSQMNSTLLLNIDI